jgi:type I restriction enzyme S subunit
LILQTPKQISSSSWLSQLPQDWKIYRFKDLFEFAGESFPDEDYPVLSLTRNGIIERDISNNDGQLAADYSDYPVITAGTFVLNPMDLIAGWVAISGLSGRVSGAYFSFKLREKWQERDWSPRFFELLFQAYYTQRILNPFGVGLGRSESGGGRWTLNRQTLGTIPFAVPPAEKQAQIVRYLDAEIVQIDELRKQNERLLQVLEDREVIKLRNLIWENPLSIYPRAKLKFHARISGGKATEYRKEQDDEHRIPVYGGNGVLGYATNGNATKGSLAVGRVGALCGNVHLLTSETWVNDNAFCISPKKSFLPEFLMELLKSRNLNELASTTAQPLLVGSLVMSEIVPVPTIEEQKDLLETIRGIHKESDDLREKTVKFIALLIERKKSAIFQAALGKLPPREGNSNGYS